MDNIETNEKNTVDTLISGNSSRETTDSQGEGEVTIANDMKSLNLAKDGQKLHHEEENDGSIEQDNDHDKLQSENPKKTDQTEEEVVAEEETEPIFDGTEVFDMDATGSLSSPSLELNSTGQLSAWPEKAAALKNFVKERGAVAVSTVFRRLSGRKDEEERVVADDEENSARGVGEETDFNMLSKVKEASPKGGERSTWNPLNYIKLGRDVEAQNRSVHPEDADLEHRVEQPAMKGRIIVYTRLGCQECKEVRSFMHQKRLKYIEINIDIYPSRKLELEKNTGSSTVPRVYFNDFLVTGLSELSALDESGKLGEKINEILNEQPPHAAPMPPLPGEDDETGSGKVDELATIVRKMRDAIPLKDRFYKMRRFNNCFLGSEAADFLSEDQYLEKEEAVEFGKKLASKYFFRHVLDENVFEDGNHLYRFLDQDPVVLTQCYNFPMGTIDVKPKPIVEISLRLRFLALAIFEAYVSGDGRHVDYRSIHGSEEFRRYVRITEELQRVELDDISREEKLAFFINLYNMMAIHAILTWGHPPRALDRRKFFGDFKYVIGGRTYSLSAIQNGILRGNQRPPYNLIKPFGPRDPRSKVALPYPEPLVHFALVCGTRSGPALRCYSPGNIDKELMEAARDFLRNGGLLVDAEAKVASVNKILRWYSVDFGENETEVLKHAANYLEPGKSEELLDLIGSTQLKVVYQPYDWTAN